MQMTGLHGTSSTKPELTQHHGQMACRTTPALTYLSLILCLSCSICAIPPNTTSLYLNLSLYVFFFNSLYLLLYLWLSFALFCSVHLSFLQSVFQLTLSLTKSLHVHNFQVPVVHPLRFPANSNNEPRFYQLKYTKTGRLLVQMR